MLLEEKKLTYSYDWNLSKHYLNGGAVPISQGVGKFGDAYLCFEIDEKLTELWRQWQKKPEWWYKAPETAVENN